MKKVIIGAGPAGLMCAIQAVRQKNVESCDILIIEKNDVIGKKLGITGKGRCNITYNGDNEYFLSNVVTNPKFLMSSIAQFNNMDLIKFVNDLGVQTKLERGNRFFLKSDNATELVSALKNEIRKLGIKILYNTSVKQIITNESKVVAVMLDDGQRLDIDSVVVATGGKSYPLTGSTGDGYILAQNLGHSIIDIKPALVPLLVYEKEEAYSLEGLTLKNVSFKVIHNTKNIYEDFGELMYTSVGVTGPVVLSSSSKINKIKELDEQLKKQNIKISIDLKSALSPEELYKRITSDFNKCLNKEFKNSLSDLLPKSLIPVVIMRSKIAPEKKVNSVTKEEKMHLVNILKNLEYTVCKLGPVSSGIVTSGGIKTNEINPKTMESKIIKGLYFAGEVLDVDAYTGGFNLQIAFSTGFVAGCNI